MRIQHNVTAMNSHRMYTINSSNMAKNVEKLSSGYKINRAGDDAAGLAISEKMRGQIRGLTMASKNSQDAISLIQTAEGALQSTQDILQRMRELAVQAASDTNLNAVDREALDMEFQQLKQEIDQTADKTEFNKMKLIDGSFGKRMTVDTGSSSSISNLKLSGAFAKGDSIQLAQFSSGVSTLSTAGPNGVIAANGNVTGLTTVVIKGATSVPSIASDGTVTNVPTNVSVAISEAAWTKTVITGVNKEGEKISIGTNFTTSFTVNGKSYTISLDVLNKTDGTFGAVTASAMGNGVSISQTSDAKIIQIGANKGDEMEVSIANMDSKSIGHYGSAKFDEETGALLGEVMTGSRLFDASVKDQTNASNAIEITDGALNMVSMQRAALGAKQNRLEFKIQNLDNSTENLQAAEARIRDTDMAKEMTAFIKNNILFQASTAMLAQANNLPQGVLQLLG